ncbi:MAG: DUF6644 family protein [Bryobacteraceae bacterium]
MGDLMTAIYPFFEWCETGPLNKIISSHEAIFPAIETFHLFGITLLLGTILVTSLRLLGVMLPKQPVAELVNELTPYTTWGLFITLCSGVPMFIGVALKCYGASWFWVKMGLLTVALTFHFGYFRRVNDADSPAARNAKLTAIIALSLWFGVGIAGRSIGFFN